MVARAAAQSVCYAPDDGPHYHCHCRTISRRIGATDSDLCLGAGPVSAHAADVMVR